MAQHQVCWHCAACRNPASSTRVKRRISPKRQWKCSRCKDRRACVCSMAASASMLSAVYFSCLFERPLLRSNAWVS
eukprot:6205679-Pleurochrysis_carterae.AAC.5